MFLSEWSEFPSAPCLAGEKKLDDSSRLVVTEISRVPDIFLPCRSKDLAATPVLNIHCAITLYSNPVTFQNRHFHLRFPDQTFVCISPVPSFPQNEFL